MFAALRVKGDNREMLGKYKYYVNILQEWKSASRVCIKSII